MAPWTIGGSNTLPFDYLFKSDLAYALKQLSIPVPSYLVASPMQPLVPFKNVNTSTPETPTVSGKYCSHMAMVRQIQDSRMKWTDYITSGS